MKMKGIVVTVLVVALIAIGSFIGSLVYAVRIDDSGSHGKKEIYHSAEEVLLSFMGDDAAPCLPAKRKCSLTHGPRRYRSSTATTMRFRRKSIRR